MAADIGTYPGGIIGVIRLSALLALMTSVNAVGLHANEMAQGDKIAV